MEPHFLCQGVGTIMSSKLEEKKFLQEMLTPVEGESSSSALNCWHLKTKGECSVTEFWLPRQNESPKLVLRLGFLFTHKGQHLRLPSFRYILGVLQIFFRPKLSAGRYLQKRLISYPTQKVPVELTLEVQGTRCKLTCLVEHEGLEGTIRWCQSWRLWTSKNVGLSLTK